MMILGEKDKNKREIKEEIEEKQTPFEVEKNPEEENYGGEDDIREEVFGYKRNGCLEKIKYYIRNNMPIVIAGGIILLFIIGSTLVYLYK
ncbi:MAG: hypothetical protein MJ252_28110, partial [archaeon]|nr:hypothetical protein [archaeon]